MKADVILETQSGEDCEGLFGTLADFLKNHFSNNQPSNLEGESIKVVVSDNVVLEKSQKRSSRASQSTPVKVSEKEHCHDEPSQHKIIDRDELIKRIDYEMVQLGWTKAIALVVGKEEVGDDLAIKSSKWGSSSHIFLVLIKDWLLMDLRDLLSGRKRTQYNPCDGR